MAQVQVETDIFTAGRWTLRSEHPAALAAVGDVLVHSLGLQSDVLSLWALHHDEQNEQPENAYLNERQELGQHAVARIHLNPRPLRTNVVWVDRIHLLATSVPPGQASRLLGLYVASAGDIRVAIHDPSASLPVTTELDRYPEIGPLDRDGTGLSNWSRVVIAVDQQLPGAVRVLAPQPMAMAVQNAITQLQAAVAHL